MACGTSYASLARKRYGGNHRAWREWPDPRKSHRLRLARRNVASARRTISRFRLAHRRERRGDGAPVYLGTQRGRRARRFSRKCSPATIAARRAKPLRMSIAGRSAAPNKPPRSIPCQPTRESSACFPNFSATAACRKPAGKQRPRSQISPPAGGTTRILSHSTIQAARKLCPYADARFHSPGFDRAKFVSSSRTIKQSRKNARITSAGAPESRAACRARKAIVAATAKTIVISHGVEVWEPLSPQRRKALLAADLVLAPSSYTAQKLTQIQNVRPKKSTALPWPLDPGFLALAADPSSLPLPPEFPVAVAR